jgi:subtilisin family serine protease
MTRRRHLAASTLALAALAACSSDSPAPLSPSTPSAASAGTNGSIAINVLLNSPLTAARRTELARYGNVRDELTQINALTMRVAADQLGAIRALSYVASAAPDQERHGAPTDAVQVADFASGVSTWDQDAINVTISPLTNARGVVPTGAGVYVGVLDTGLLDSWRQYFPEERIAEEYARSFGGSDNGTVAEQPNKWEHDQNSHGTHVTSTILGYQLGAMQINGTAPLATVIPVKVLGQNGSGSSASVARGIEYIGQLKAGPLKNSPVVINMSLGGGRLDAVEQAAIDYAIAQGVIIVASAGNSGTAGMGYPGAYAPVISVASLGWKQEFTAASWWRTLDVPEGDLSQYVVSGFSSRALIGQDLDVAAPGQNIVGPYQLNSGKTDYYYLSGTSMSSPHVAGIAALMAQGRAKLTGPQVEAIMEVKAVKIPGATEAEQGKGLITADAALAGIN